MSEDLWSNAWTSESSTTVVSDKNLATQWPTSSQAHQENTPNLSQPAWSRVSDTPAWKGPDHSVRDEDGSPWKDPFADNVSSFPTWNNVRQERDQAASPTQTSVTAKVTSNNSPVRSVRSLPAELSPQREDDNLSHKEPPSIEEHEHEGAFSTFEIGQFRSPPKWSSADFSSLDSEQTRVWTSDAEKPALIERNDPQKPDIWESALKDRTERESAVSSDVMSMIMDRCEELVSSDWSQANTSSPPYDYRGSNGATDMTGVLGFAELVNWIGSHQLESIPGTASHIRSQIQNGLKASNSSAVSNRSPFAYFKAAQGSSWETSVKLKADVQSDWWGASIKDNALSNPRLVKPRELHTIASSLSQQSTVASGLSSPRHSVTLDTTHTEPSLSTTPPVTLAATSTASQSEQNSSSGASAVSRFLGRFGRTKTTGPPTSRRASADFLSSKDLQLLSDVSTELPTPVSGPPTGTADEAQASSDGFFSRWRSAKVSHSRTSSGIDPYNTSLLDDEDNAAISDLDLSHSRLVSKPSLSASPPTLSSVSSSMERARLPSRQPIQSISLLPEMDLSGGSPPLVINRRSDHELLGNTFYPDSSLAGLMAHNRQEAPVASHVPATSSLSALSGSDHFDDFSDFVSGENVGNESTSTTSLLAKRLSTNQPSTSAWLLDDPPPAVPVKSRNARQQTASVSGNLAAIPPPPGYHSRSLNGLGRNVPQHPVIEQKSLIRSQNLLLEFDSPEGNPAAMDRLTTDLEIGGEPQGLVKPLTNTRQTFPAGHTARVSPSPSKSSFLPHSLSMPNSTSQSSVSSNGPLLSGKGGLSAQDLSFFESI